jgi:hypothetical protein
MTDPLRCLGELSVGDIEDITWDSAAFSSLVMPNDRKEIVQSLVERRTENLEDPDGEQFDDIIRGKGQSLVILLQYDSSLCHIFYY